MLIELDHSSIAALQDDIRLLGVAPNWLRFCEVGTRTEVSPAWRETSLQISYPFARRYQGSETLFFVEFVEPGGEDEFCCFYVETHGVVVSLRVSHFRGVRSVGNVAPWLWAGNQAQLRVCVDDESTPIALAFAALDSAARRLNKNLDGVFSC